MGISLSGTKAQYAECTAATDCKNASSCCTAFGTSATATTLSTVKVCFDAGTAVGGYTIPVAGGVTSTMLTSGKGYLQTACPKAAAGASTLAVSAAAVATAVYMM